MIDREAHSLLNNSNAVLPTEAYIRSIKDQSELRQLIDRLKRLRKLYVNDSKLHKQIHDLYLSAVSRDFHLFANGFYGSESTPGQETSVSKAVQLLDEMIHKADGDGTFRGGKDPAELQEMREQAKEEAGDYDPGVEKGRPVTVDHAAKAKEHMWHAKRHQDEANFHTTNKNYRLAKIHQDAADNNITAARLNNKAAQDPTHSSRAINASEKAHDSHQKAQHASAFSDIPSYAGPRVPAGHPEWMKADPGEEAGSFRGGDPEELQRKREEKRTENIESGQAAEQQEAAGAEDETVDPAAEQEAQEKEEEKEQSKSMDAQSDSTGPGSRMLALEVSPVDTFGDYNPRNANGDPVDLKARAQDYNPPGPPRQGKNQWRPWSEVIGIKIPLAGSPIQELRRFYARGDGEGATRASQMMPKSMVASMIKALEEGGGTGNIAPSGAESRARGGKYIKRQFMNGRWEYTYQDDMHPNHGPGQINEPVGHTLDVHPSFGGGSPEDAFNHSLHMHAVEGGDHPSTIWDDDRNAHVEKVIHFPGAEKDEEGNFKVDPNTKLPKLDERSTAIVRDPGQTTGGKRVSNLNALHKMMKPVTTVKDAHGDPWVHVRPVISSKAPKEGAKRLQGGAPEFKYDPSSRFSHPDDVARGWQQSKTGLKTGKPAGTDEGAKAKPLLSRKGSEDVSPTDKLIQNLEHKKGIQEFLKKEAERGSVPLADRKKAKDWPTTYHEVWNHETGKKRLQDGKPVMAEQQTTNTLERGDKGVWKWGAEDRGQDFEVPSTGTVRHRIKRGQYLDFDNHDDRNNTMWKVMHENYGNLYSTAIRVLKYHGRIKYDKGGVSPESEAEAHSLVTGTLGKYFHNAIDSYNPHHSSGARLSTHLVNHAMNAMQEELPNIDSVDPDERLRIMERRQAARSQSPIPRYEYTPRPDIHGEEASGSSFGGEETKPRSRVGRSSAHGRQTGGLGLQMGSPYQMDAEERLLAQERIKLAEKKRQEAGLSPAANPDEYSDEELSASDHDYAPEDKENYRSHKPIATAAPSVSVKRPTPKPRSDVYEPTHGQEDVEDYGAGRGRYRKSIVDSAACVLFKAFDDEEGDGTGLTEKDPHFGSNKMKYMWREGEPGAHKYMWEAPNGDVVRATNAPTDHPHHDPEAGEPELHPHEPTPTTAPHLFDKHGRKLHRPVPDGVESEHNDHYDPDVNNWAERYNDPETGNDEHVYLHKDRVKDHRLKFNEDLRNMDAQLEKVRQWYKSLIKAKDPVHQAIGLIFALMDQARMVSDGTDSGLLSVKVGDVKQSGNTFAFTYHDAKKEPHNVQVVLDNAAGSVLHGLMQGKSPKDPLFVVNGQQIEHPMLAKVFDDQFGLNLNQMRVFHGTEMFSKEFQNQASTHPNLSPEDLPKLANRSYGRIARMMGHVKMSPKLAQQMYVDPIAVEALYMSSIHHHHPEFNKSLTKAHKIEDLPEVNKETWDDGSVITHRKSPFPTERKPQIPSRLHKEATVEDVPLSSVKASQSTITHHGVEKYKNPTHSENVDDLPLVYKMPNGSHIIGDGHHRMVAAHIRGEDSVRSRVVTVPKDMAKAQKVDERTNVDSIGVVGKMVFQGLPVSIENPAGSVRKWHNKDTGECGKTTMRYPYGFIRNTEGIDHGEVDVYIGPHRNSERVFVIHQMKGPEFKEYDEDKCMLGFRIASEAKEAYLKHYDDPKFFGGMTAMAMREFKNKVFSTKDHPHIITKDKIPGGLSEGKSDTDFDPDAVMVGMKVEMEHTNDPSVAYEITKDHLSEDRKYYKKLKEIEKAISESARGPFVWHVSASHPDRTEDEEAFGKWIHSHPMHDHEQQWAAFKVATRVPDVPIPDPQREYADGSKQPQDGIEKNPHLEQEEPELSTIGGVPASEAGSNPVLNVAKSILEDLMGMVN